MKMRWIELKCHDVTKIYSVVFLFKSSGKFKFNAELVMDFTVQFIIFSIFIILWNIWLKYFCPFWFLINTNIKIVRACKFCAIAYHEEQDWIFTWSQWNRIVIEFSDFSEFRESDKSLKQWAHCLTHESYWHCGGIPVSYSRVSGLNPFNDKYFCHWIISVKTFRKNSNGTFFVLVKHMQSIDNMEIVVFPKVSGKVLNKKAT